MLPIHSEGGDLVAAWRQIDDALELMEDFEDSIGCKLDAIDIDRLHSPLLSHVGVLDINKAWERVSEVESTEEGSEPIAVRLAHAYAVAGSFPVYSIRLELETELHRKFGIEGRAVIDNEVSSQRGLGQKNFATLQNEFYPVDNGGLVSELANSTLWRRILCIPQLGWKDNYPLENVHSRGAHSLFAAINKVRVLQGLYDRCPERLTERLKQDFAIEEIDTHAMSDDDICLLAADLATLVGMLHDVYTPAYGDMMKHFMGMDEEADASNLLLDDDRVKELVSILESRGLGRDCLKFVVDCIQGKSDSLIGGMIHSESDDVLEQDRLAYTVQDLFSAGILGPAVARELFDGSSLAKNEGSLLAAWNSAIYVLNDDSTWTAGPLFTGEATPSLSLLDVSDDYILNENLELVCERPDKLAWLMAFRTMMSMEFYQGVKLRGQERELSEALEVVRDSGRAYEVLNKENLQRVNNLELTEQLRELGDQNLNNLLDDMDKMIFHHRYSSEIVEKDAKVDGVWMELPLSVKPGLDSKVMDGEEEISLGEYVLRNPQSLAVRLFKDIIETRQGKKRIIRKVY